MPMRICVLLFLFIPATASGADVNFDWSDTPDRIWIGPEFWANRLHDWRVADGRVECVAEQPRLKMRTLQLLTHQFSRDAEWFAVDVRMGLSNRVAENASDTSLGGVLIGVGTDLTAEPMDYRSAALIHGASGRGGGMFIGLNAKGELIVRNNTRPGPPRVIAQVASRRELQEGVMFQFGGRRKEDKATLYDFSVSVKTGDGETALSTVAWSRIDPVLEFGAEFSGGLALVSHPGVQQQDRFGGRWWFDMLTLRGDDIEEFPDRALGPIVSSMYTVSRGTMKMTAQFMPIGADEPRTAFLGVQREDGTWTTIDTAQVEEPDYTAVFRDDAWDASRSSTYRVLYSPSRPTDDPDQDVVFHSWTGTIQRDPVDKETIVVAGFTGNHNNAHGFSRDDYNYARNIWFPHVDVTAAVAHHQPDLLFFSGDQVYEGDSPTFADSNPDNIKLDYLYKWYLWCWAYRDLTKDIPAICIPDDHDVFQGNIWGQGGRKSPGRDHHGGYVHPADFVAMVERTQTANLPDPYSSEPLEQGLTSYYTSLVWGRIGVAVLEDRKFKSGCARDDMPPSGTGRPDHFNDPDFDVAKLDVPGVQLLGAKQLEFIDDFAQDWTGQDMKMAVSQTIFANMATHHGGNLQRLIADLDSNGWPQSGRNRAVDALRKGYIFHLAGDQHLATIVHHGIEKHGDAIWSFCVPSVANFYPRAWAPELPGEYSRPEPDTFTGPRYDGFGHPVIVYAASNPGRDMGHEPANLHNGMPGYGIVRLNKANRTITMECWPRFAGPGDPAARQYDGWPKMISQFDNYAAEPVGYLADLEIRGAESPVVQVVNQETGEIGWTVRIPGISYRVPVFADGEYRVEIAVGDEVRSVGPLEPRDEPERHHIDF